MYGECQRHEVTCATALLVYVSLFALFTMKHVVSIVDRHTSNGVEGHNKQILHHLKALVVQDERTELRWSDPIYSLRLLRDG